MELDPEYLRQRYDSLSDEALLAVDRNELVEMAQRILDEEIGRRGLARRGDTRGTHIIPTQPDLHDEEAELDGEPPDAGDEPAWLEDAAEVYSRTVNPGTAPAPAVAEAAPPSQETQPALQLQLAPAPRGSPVEPEPAPSPSPDHTHRQTGRMCQKLSHQRSSA